MYFRNATFYRYPPSVNFDTLEDALQEHKLRPVGALELSSQGFVSPFGRDAETLAHAVGQHIWISLGAEEKILPGSVVTDLLAKRLAKLEASEGRRLGGRARRRVKEDLVHELLPRALVRPSRTNAIIDTDRRWIAIDTSSRKAAEDVVSALRRALGSLPALPLNAEVAPRAVMTAWLAGDPQPEGIALGNACVLREPADRGARAALSDIELGSEEVQGHLNAGMQAERLALEIHNRQSFVFGDDLIVRKLKLLDGALESLDSTERENLRAELEARFVLMAFELRLLFEALSAPFKFSEVDRG